jgi:ribosomal protein S18 acetylase RimI-like enzyme
MQISYYQTKTYADFTNLIYTLQNDLGDGFPLSIQCWCGIKARPYPLNQWEIFLGKNEYNDIVGIFSYYQQVNDPVNRFWIGWLGVKPPYRRQGIASYFIELVESFVRNLDGTELWVYTDSGNIEATSLYKKKGMHPKGTFGDYDYDQIAATDDSIVLMKYL